MHPKVSPELTHKFSVKQHPLLPTQTDALDQNSDTEAAWENTAACDEANACVV